MKRAASVLAVFATAITLSACESKGGSTAVGTDAPPTKTTPAAARTTTGSQTAGAPAMTPSTSAPTASALPPGPKTYHAAQTTTDGYKQSMTLTLYPAIPGRDLTALNKAWTAVGGTGNFPCEDAAGLDMSTLVSIPTHSSVYAVGTLSITNDTPDFGDGGMMWDFAGPDTNGYAMGFGYSNSPECDSLSSGTLTKPHWTGPMWGPVPIVVAYGDVVNPDHPDGDYTKIAAAPIALPLATATITSSGSPVTGIIVTPADPVWLRQAQNEG